MQKIDMRDILRKIFSTRNLVIGGCLFLVGLLLIMLFDNVIMPWYTKHGEALAVPNTIAQPYDSAKEMLESEGLVVVKAGEKNDPNLLFGHIVEQNPAPNRLVKKGRRVYLTISIGEREVQAPNLVGLSETNARERLKSYGLRLGEIEYEFSHELRDVVIKQSVEAESAVKMNSVIDITVSNGEPTENVTVPSLLGKTIDAAKRDIQKSGLMLGEISYKVSSEFLPNTVLDQSLEAGQIVSHGEVINLLVTVLN